MTKDNTLALSGTVSDANLSSVHVFDGATDLGAATISGGTWSFTTSALSDGSHSFTAKATDTAGNSTTTSAVTATIDTTAPTVVITTAGGSINQAAQTLTGTVDVADIGTTVTLFDNGGATALGTAIVQNDGSWSTGVTLLGNGTHSIVAKDTDAAGNIGASSAIIYTLSTIGPTVTESLVADTGASSTDKITSNDALTGSGDANAVVTLKEGTTVLGTTTANGAGLWSFTPTGLSDGSHTIVASETDAFGNTGTAALSFTLDTTNPSETISSTIGTDSGATTTISSGGVTKDNTLALSGTVSDANLSSVHVFDGATDLGAATISGSNWSFTTSALTDGSHSFTAKATDTAGNSTTTSAVTATVDTTNPSETISSTIGTDSGATTTISSGGVTKDNTLALSGTVSDANLSSVHVFDGATDLGAATISGGNWSFTTSALSDGSHIFTAKATDTAGNSTTTSAVTATVDTTAPVTTPVTLAAIAEDGGPHLITQAQLLANAADVDGPALTATGLAIATGGGTLVNNNNGTWSYTPALNDDTSVSFSYTVTDGSLTAAGSAAAGHHAGQRCAGDDAGDAGGDAEDSGPHLITQAELLANAADVDGPALTATSLAIAAGNGTLVDNPTAPGAIPRPLNDDSAVSFSYTVSDGSLSAAGRPPASTSPRSMTRRSARRSP